MDSLPFLRETAFQESAEIPSKTTTLQGENCYVKNLTEGNSDRYPVWESKQFPKDGVEGNIKVKRKQNKLTSSVPRWQL